MAEFREFQDGELIADTRYRVVRLVGVGGMGSVYEVEHVELGKRFVLKALLRELARREDLVQRMRNEWRALARLQHLNIVNVTDAGTSGNGVPYYVMELLEGETLGARLKRAGRMAVPDAIRVAASVLEGLSAAHDIGVVHRDVKPPNIFLLRDGTVKLLDFGVAKMADASSVITARGIAVGTPRYMSPEQARGEAVDGRSDIYATGLILFEMLTGAGPFDDARDANELLLAHLARQPPPLSRLALGIAPELEQIVASMLAKDHRERPLRAATVAVALRAFVSARAGAPASDASTGFAAYSAQTAGRPLPHSPQRELETRPDGPVRRTLLMTDDTTTAQVTLTLNGDDQPTSVQKTVIDAPVFGATHAPNTTLPLVYASAQVTQAMAPLERPVERTEILTGAVAAPQEPEPTRTRVPFAETPHNLTPPPVVQTGPMRRPLRREQTLALAAAVVLLVAGGAGLFALRRPAAVSVPPMQSAVPAAPSPVAELGPPEPAPPALASPTAAAPSLADQPKAPSSAPSAEPQPAAEQYMPAASALSASAPAAPPRPRAAASSVAGGPFLAAASAKKPAPAAPPASNQAKKPAEPKFVLPASGL